MGDDEFDEFGCTTAPGPSTAWAGPDADSIWLSLNGAMGRTFQLKRLGEQYPVLVVDGWAVRRSAGGYLRVPMADGSTEKLDAYAVVPGVLTVKFKGQKLYRAPGRKRGRILVWVVPTVIVAALSAVAQALVSRG